MRSFGRIALKALKITAITILSLLALLFILPYIFPHTINRKIDEWANRNINGNITFSNTRLSFFKKFPALTLTMYDVTLKGSAPFEKDTLIASREISLGIDLSSVFKSKVTINKIFLEDAFFNIQVDSAGHANYYIYQSKAQKSAAVDTNGGASLGINQILIENSRLVYNDRSLPMLINARGLNYSGNGDLSKDIFSLNTHTDIQSFDFYYNNQPYVLSKKINADLVTEIDTRSLTFIFRKNNLMINQLPVEFNGRFGFITDGYDMDFNIDSHENDIDVLLTALPAEYQKMLENTQVDGVGNIQVELAGKYIAKDSIMPGLSMSVKVRNGYISNQKSPSPVQNLYLDMHASFPGFNPDSLLLSVDSLYFNIADGYLSSVMRVKGITRPDIYAKVNSEIDLEKWNRALGVKPFQVKGKYSLHLLAEGTYATEVVHKGLRNKADTVISSIPQFTLTSSFKDGYFKYASVPEAVQHINFDMQASCADNDYKHIKMSVNDLSASAMNNYIKGSFSVGNLADWPIDAALQAQLKLDDIKQFYPIAGMDLKGDLNADIRAKGNYLPEKKKYPVVQAHLTMHNGYVKTKYYPHPIERIEVNTTLNDKTGSLSGLNASIAPITFQFENEPFSLSADLQDFTNVAYKIKMNGTLDVGKIYRVFAQKGYNVTGTIAANLSLKGRQSDATAGHYDKLSNKGSLKFRDITCTTELYPQPFFISRGDFSFKQDKMLFDSFVVKYAHSTITLNGALSNVIDYIVKPGAILTGAFNLHSDLLVADDFMAFADTSKSSKPAAKSTASLGVVMVPRNLNLDFTANVKTVKYTDILLQDTHGHLMLRNDSLLLRETGFTLIGALVSMDATYASINPQKAYFDYHISANDFDVKKAYNSIKLFHDLASSAAHAEGLISIDYQLQGNLNSGMMPVYPSLKGGGTLSAKKVKMHGFKLFNAIGREAKQDSMGNNSDVSKIAIKSTIANNVISIERTKMKLSIFRARLEGKVSFSNMLDLKFRLGLPPLGLIGIPMTISGSEESPKIDMRKDKKEDEVQETPDADD